MARHKEFDRDHVLRAAVQVFWRQGYTATTAADLVGEMGIGRQSFYDTFGDKRQCYLEALRVYTREEIPAQLGAAPGDVTSPLERLRAFLHVIADRPAARRLLGCMMVNAVAEDGDAPDLAAVTGPSRRQLLRGVTELLRAAKARGEVDESLDEERAAHALLLTRLGLMLSAKAGQSPTLLRNLADFAVDQLRAPRPASGAPGLPVSRAA